jgi:hypothetical protein
VNSRKRSFLLCLFAAGKSPVLIVSFSLLSALLGRYRTSVATSRLPHLSDHTSVTMLHSLCPSLGVDHSLLPEAMILCPYCGLRLQIPSQQKEPVLVQQSTFTSAATAPSSRTAIPSNITAKGKEKVPTHDADSDIEILEVEPSITCHTWKPF